MVLVGRMLGCKKLFGVGMPGWHWDALGRAGSPVAQVLAVEGFPGCRRTSLQVSPPFYTPLVLFIAVVVLWAQK